MRRLILSNLFFIVVLSLHGQINFASVDTLTFVGSEDIYDQHRIQYVDLDKDNLLDLLLTRQHQIVFRKGQGDGSFGQDQVFFRSEDIIYDISTPYDLNADGYPDFSLKTSAELLVLNGSNEGFQVEARSSSEDRYTQMEWVDFEGDGSVDLVARLLPGESSSNRLIINRDWRADLLGFEDLITATTWDYAFYDANDDGRLDIAAAVRNTFRIYFQNEEGGLDDDFAPSFRNYGVGRFILVDALRDDDAKEIYFLANDEVNIMSYSSDHHMLFSSSIYQTGDLPVLESFGLGDVTGDGRLDLLLISLKKVYYMEGERTRFKDPVLLDEVRLTGGTDGIITRDLNQDGVQDIIVHEEAYQDVLLINESVSIDSLITDDIYPSPTNMEIADLDGDGFEDLVISLVTGRLNIKWGSGDGSFEEESDIEINGTPLKTLIYDFDKDGMLDILYSVDSDSRTDDHGILLVKGKGGRMFEEPRLWRKSGDVLEMYVVDSNLDGEDEIFFYTYTGNFRSDAEVAWSDKDFTNVFSRERFTIPDAENIENLAFADFNGDGYPDIATSNRFSDNVSILINDQSGSFSASNIDYVDNESPVHVEATDFNDDGIMDLMVAYRRVWDGFVDVYRGIGDGAFSRVQTIDVSEVGSLDHMDLIDIDNDGDDDIILGSLSYLYGKVIENRNGNFQPLDIHVQSVGRGARAYGDINGDGTKDIITVAEAYGNLFVQLNTSTPRVDITDLTATVEEGIISSNIAFSQTNDLRLLVVLKEGDEALTDAPVINTFYQADLSFGSGHSFGGGHVVSNSTQTALEISNLKPSTDYSFYAYGFIVDPDDNSKIEYSNDFVTGEFTTNTSIFLLQDLGPFTFNEEENLEVILADYINNLGDNTFDFSGDNQDILTNEAQGVLTLSANSDYFGIGSVSVQVENAFEAKSYDFSVTVLSVNDAPVIESIADQEMDTDGIDIPFNISDVDNDLGELTVMAISSNEAVLSQQSISIIRGEESSVMRLSPITRGNTTITLSVSDGELTTDTSFEVEVSLVTNIDDPFSIPGVKIYPNPTKDFLHISSGSVVKDLKLLDAKGNLIKEFDQVPSKLGVSHLKSGLYILRIGQQTFRFIKQ